MNTKAMRMCGFLTDTAIRLSDMGAHNLAKKAFEKAAHYRDQMWPERPAPVRGLDYYYEYNYAEFMRRVYPSAGKV